MRKVGLLWILCISGLFLFLFFYITGVLSSKNVDPVFEDITFPENFFFGTASSDFQTTGGDKKTDWNLYIEDCIKTKGCVSEDILNNTSNPIFVGPDTGTDFLNRYQEDFDLAAGKTQVHRLSLEWSRVEPEEGKFDKEIIEKYKEIFTYMKSKGIEPMICLNHFALPLWFVEKGGWESAGSPLYLGLTRLGF